MGFVAAGDPVGFDARGRWETQVVARPGNHAGGLPGGDGAVVRAQSLSLGEPVWGGGEPDDVVNELRPDLQLPSAGTDDGKLVAVWVAGDLGGARVGAGN